ncbi:MAG: hypothetical protein AAGJ79_00625 [Verrucomicrobiota bacterium]
MALDYDWEEQFWILDPTSLIYHADTQRAELFSTEVERNLCDATSKGQTVRYEVVLRSV